MAARDTSEFSHLLSDTDKLLSDLLWNKGHPSENVKEKLLDVTKNCFLQIEELAILYKSHLAAESEGISGLDELYMKNDDGENVDTETIWGQVDLQNHALHSMLKSSLRSLKKATKRRGKKAIRLLEEDGEQEELNGNDYSELESSSGRPSDNDVHDEDDDGEREKMRRRMEQAMHDMEEEEGGGDDLSEEEGCNSQENIPQDIGERNDDDVLDPAREDLNDGFFDLHEMEDFADEEEEYLPDSAFGEENPEDDQFDQRTFHQKQRDGDVDRVSDEEVEEENALTRKANPFRRKRYRLDDEVNALYQLYDEPGEIREEAEDDDVVNMTAADIFGKPRKNNYHERQGSKEALNGKDPRLSDDIENDSWNDYDFENAKEDSGWNNGEDRNDGDIEEDDKNLEDEVVPMKNGVAQRNELAVGLNKKLLAQTEELEKEMLAEKPWQMVGETKATTRPTNSLLDSTPEIEVATKTVPVITTDHTKSLEDIIKERVIKESWDDVVPRELPDVGWNARRGEAPEVSQEKSKLGLGELYEREYLKKALGYDVEAAEKETEEEKAKNEMKSLFASLCSKLDALSNYHFAPRPLESEAEIRSVTKPAIAMEEVLPLHVSDARGVAPEEVFETKRGRQSILRNDSEMDQSERKRKRSSKKAARRKKRKEKIADEKLISRLQPGLGLNNPYERRKMQEELAGARTRGKVVEGQMDDNEYSKSGTFFQRLQEEAQQTVRGQAKTHPSTQKDKRGGSSSSVFKL